MKKKSESELYWDSMRNNQINHQYKYFLEENDLKISPDSAYLFVSGLHRNDMNGKSERELILRLGDGLPYMYD